MPRARREVADLLERLDHCAAHHFESQHLDFKEWDTRSLNQSLRTVVTSAVCMANGGGGTVAFGVADKVVSRECAIVGVPPEVSVRRCAETGADPLVNADVRRITGLDRHQVRRMIHEFRDDGLVVIEGHGRAARYLYARPRSE